MHEVDTSGAPSSAHKRRAPSCAGTRTASFSRPRPRNNAGTLPDTANKNVTAAGQVLCASRRWFSGSLCSNGSSCTKLLPITINPLCCGRFFSCISRRKARRCVGRQPNP
ncbi:hypothetical protein A7Q01_01900 [Eikenella sp. NML96-A-049]|nr:hypothetical protein A7P97_07500 [Eikenella sp. NML070372]OAM41712.1 hypothetical protein A7Q01_01900 [Eikenella sp. NML96-A-049]